MTEATRTCACGATITRPSGMGRWPERCPDCRRKHELKQDAGYRERHQASLRKSGRARAARNRGADPEAARQHQRNYWLELKHRVLGHYGTVCACCGGTDRLSIDHINGNGAVHREELYGNPRHGSGWRFYMWLIRNNFPDGYQTLCLRCNLSKGKGERCTLDHA